MKQSGYFSRRVLVFGNQVCGLTLVHTSEKADVAIISSTF